MPEYYLKMKTEKYTWTAVTPTAWIPEKKPNFFIKLIQYILSFFRKSPELHTHFFDTEDSRCECWINFTEFSSWKQEMYDTIFQQRLEHTIQQRDQDIKERNKKLQFLHKCMMQYENKTGIPIDILKDDIIRRNGLITSRTDLTDDQLDAEIKYFTSI